MGGAPALYLRRWPTLLKELNQHGKAGWVFHSDFLLNEGHHPYNPYLLQSIAHPRALYAVDIKGWGPDEYEANTRKQEDSALVTENLKRMEDASVPFYITFTALGVDSQNRFWDSYASWSPNYERRRAESFSIDIINYHALVHVDDISWGKVKYK